MSKIATMLDIGRRSMMNSQTALQTVSHNIANKSTDGYSRQRVELQSNEPIGQGKLRMGTGAKAAAVRRIHNEFLEKQLQTEHNKMGFTQGQSETLSRVEQIFNEQSNKGLNRFVSEFFNSFRELANTPESLANRTLVRETAAHMTRDFARVSRQLKEIQREIDHQVENEVEEINSMAREIADLNQKIQLVEVQGGEPNDERDRREVLLRNLGEKVNIRVAESKDGVVSVTAGDTAVLVSGYEAASLKTTASSDNGHKREGNFDVVYFSDERAAPVTVTRQLRSGTIGGALDVRDRVVNELLDKIDGFAYTIADEVNQAHEIGYDRYNRQGGAFFERMTGTRDAAEKIAVRNDIFDDLGKIATAAAPDSPGDNRAALVIAAIQNQPLMANGTTSMDDYFNGVVGKLAVETKKSNSVHEHQKNVLEQLQNVRESIAGVNLDEEAIHMIEYQKAFDASAKMVKVADEMLGTVINLINR